MAQYKEPADNDKGTATDSSIKKKFGSLNNAYEEGFGASHGLRGQTAESGGKIKHPEIADEAKEEKNPLDKENPGLA